MQIEYKAVGVSGVQMVEDEGEGLVRAIVSVTGLKDNVNDIIEPGAYTESLQKRLPKGVWHHQWHESVSRTEAIKELMPGDPNLPEALPDGSPWPEGAGALQVDTRFNLKTQRGREAYEDVKFFGPQQEWSIGYNVPVGGATRESKSNIRRIKKLDLYEYSPVLFGAMPVARTASVKDAQSSFMEVKSLHGEDAEKFLMDMKSLVGEEVFYPESKGSDLEDDEPPYTDDDDWYDDEDEDEDDDPQEDMEESKGLSAHQKENILVAIKALRSLLGEAPNVDHKRSVSVLAELAEAAEMKDDAQMLALDFDEAVEEGDAASAVELADKLLSDIEDHAGDNGESKSLEDMVQHIKFELKMMTTDDEDDDDLDEDWTSEEETDEADEVDDEAKSQQSSLEVKSIDMSAINAVLSDD